MSIALCRSVAYTIVDKSDTADELYLVGACWVLAEQQLAALALGVMGVLQPNGFASASV